MTLPQKIENELYIAKYKWPVKANLINICFSVNCNLGHKLS